MLFFKAKSADVDPVIYQWLLDHFEWAVTTFNPDFFYNTTTIIEPTPKFFPAKVDSVDGYVKHIVEQLQQFTGVQHWPFVAQNKEVSGPPAKLTFKGGLRGENSALVPSYTQPQQLLIPFDQQQINDPMHFIAYVGQTMAQYMMAMSPTPPPGNNELWQKNSEVLAVVMGLGIMISNSAYEFRGGCSSCVNPNAMRPAQLQEFDCLTAFALFCFMKDFAKSEALAVGKKHLKKHLRSDFKALLNYVYQDSKAQELKSRLATSIKKIDTIDSNAQTSL